MNTKFIWICIRASEEAIRNFSNLDKIKMLQKYNFRIYVNIGQSIMAAKKLKYLPIMSSNIPNVLLYSYIDKLCKHRKTTPKLACIRVVYSGKIAFYK